MNTTKKLEIIVDDYQWTCSDGCCTDYGTSVTINGEELPVRNYQDVGTHLRQVLEHLGYEVNLIETYNGENE